MKSTSKILTATIMATLLSGVSISNANTTTTPVTSSNTAGTAYSLIDITSNAIGPIYAVLGPGSLDLYMNDGGVIQHVNTGAPGSLKHGEAVGISNTNLIVSGGTVNINVATRTADIPSPVVIARNWAKVWGMDIASTGHKNLVDGNVVMNLEAIAGNNATAVSNGGGSAQSNTMAYVIGARNIGTGAMTNIAGNLTINANAKSGDNAYAGGTSTANATLYVDALAYAITTYNGGKFNLGGNFDANLTVKAGNNAVNEAINLNPSSATALGSVLLANGTNAVNTINGNLRATIDAEGGDNSDVSGDAAIRAVWADTGGANIIYGNVDLDLKARSGANNAANGLDNYAIIHAIRANDGSNVIGGDVKIKAESIVQASSTGNAWAYGIRAENNGSVIISGNADMDITTKASHATNSAAYAYGILTRGNSSTCLEGDIKIVANADATAGNNFKSYSVVASNGGDNQLDLPGFVKQFEGIVEAVGTGTNPSKNTILLDMPGSYLQGNILDDGTGINDITLENEGTWRPVYDNRYGEFFDPADSATHTKTYTVTDNSVPEITMKQDGIIDMVWDGTRTHYRNLDIETLNGSGGNFKVATDLASGTNGDKVVVTNGEASATHYIGVTDASLLTGQTVVGPAKLLVATDLSQNITFLGKTLDTGGLWQTTPTIENLDPGNWYLTMVQAEANPSTATLIGNMESTYGLWRSILTDDTLRKRLGDLRMGVEEAGGVWARAKAGSLSGNNYNSKYQTFQVGIDKTVGNKTYGMAVDHSNTSSDLASGSGDGSMTGLSLYMTTYKDSGLYSDVVLRGGKLRSGVNTYGQYPDSLDFDAYGYSASYEIGKTNTQENGWFTEPQAQLVLGHLNGGEYRTARDTYVDRNGVNTLIARVGVVAGRKINKDSDYYFKANVYHEFLGKDKMDLLAANGERMSYEGENSGTWFEVGVGTNIKLSKQTYFYGDVAKTFGGDIKKKWQVNAGMRFTW